jgi:hypothetical protein
MKPKRGYRKKSYGQYQNLKCPFCERMATHKNKKGVAVCFRHQEISLDEFKCTCGEWLEAKESQFGPYFRCINCGNVSYQKALEMKEITAGEKQKAEEVKKTYFAPPQSVSLEQVNKEIVQKAQEGVKKALRENKPELRKEEKRERKETTITTDDLEYFD